MKIDKKFEQIGCCPVEFVEKWFRALSELR